MDCPLSLLTCVPSRSGNRQRNWNGIGNGSENFDRERITRKLATYHVRELCSRHQHNLAVLRQTDRRTATQTEIETEIERQVEREEDRQEGRGR